MDIEFGKKRGALKSGLLFFLTNNSPLCKLKERRNIFQRHFIGNVCELPIKKVRRWILGNITSISTFEMRAVY